MPKPLAPRPPDGGASVEHANLTVSDLDATLAFLKVICPSWRIRGGGPRTDPDGRWMHVGDDYSYVALEATDPCQPPRKPYRSVGFNHIGLIVSDLQATMARVRAAGLRVVAGADQPHRRNVYVYDPDGLEWELVEYQSEDPDHRNTYSD